MFGLASIFGSGIAYPLNEMAADCHYDPLALAALGASAQHVRSQHQYADYLLAQRGIAPSDQNILYLLAQQNYFRVPEKPLDERYADFKARLAEALAKRGPR